MDTMQKENPEKAAEAFIQMKDTIVHLKNRFKEVMQKAIAHLLFGILGSGTNYLVPVALFLQLPLMQVAQPEGIRLASHMNLAVNVAPISLSVLYARFVKKQSKIAALVFALLFAAQRLALVLASGWAV